MILVVGGTGFIGKTLLLRLRIAGLGAITVSRNPDRDFLAAHLSAVRALTLESFLKQSGEILPQITGCVYLASAGRLGDNRDTPWLEAEQMLSPLIRMLHLVGTQGRGATPFVYLSSAAVYGPRDAHLLDEAMSPHPATAYGTGKVMAEAAVEAASRRYGLLTRILRPSTPIGRWQGGTARGAVGALMDASAGGTTFFLNGDGSAVRDYFDADDLAQAILAALGAPHIAHGLWNVGSGTGVSLTRLIAEICEVTGRPITLERRPMPAGEVARAVLDIGRIRADLGWSPETTLRQSLAAIWAARQTG